MPSEVAAEAAEPLHEPRQQHGQGEWHLHRALHRPGERSEEEKLQLCHSSFLGIFKKKSPGAEALLSFRAAHDGMCAFALVSECHCCCRLIIISN